MALTLPPRKYLSAIKSIPSWVSAGPPALIATTSRLERITPLEELDDEEELLDDELPDDELELLEDELLDEEVEELEGSAPGSLPPQPANSNAAHNKASHASRAFRFIALIDIVHPVNFQQRIFVDPNYDCLSGGKKRGNPFPQAVTTVLPLGRRP